MSNNLSTSSIQSKDDSTSRFLSKEGILRSSGFEYPLSSSRIELENPTLLLGLGVCLSY